MPIQYNELLNQHFIILIMRVIIIMIIVIITMMMMAMMMMTMMILLKFNLKVLDLGQTEIPREEVLRYFKHVIHP